jgi:hypothetical protein
MKQSSPVPLSHCVNAEWPRYGAPHLDSTKSAKPAIKKCSNGWRRPRLIDDNRDALSSETVKFMTYCPTLSRIVFEAEWSIAAGPEVSIEVNHDRH